MIESQKVKEQVHFTTNTVACEHEWSWIFSIYVAGSLFVLFSQVFSLFFSRVQCAHPYSICGGIERRASRIIYIWLCQFPNSTTDSRCTSIISLFHSFQLRQLKKCTCKRKMSEESAKYWNLTISSIDRYPWNGYRLSTQYNVLCDTILLHNSNKFILYSRSQTK